MTFKEKVQTEHPEMVDKRFGGGVKGCPYHYGYEKNLNCMVWESNAECEECWNREMPDTETKEIEYCDKCGYIKEQCECEEEKADVSFTDDLLNQGYNKGLNDAWELVKKIYAIDDRSVVFDGHVFVEYILRAYTPQEALAKLKAYEEQIEVGDVVEAYEKKFVIANITRTEDATTYFGIARDGMLMCSEEVKKTGKHIDIKSILEQIGEWYGKRNLI